MRNSGRRMLAVACSLALGIGGLLVAASPAQAQTVASGSLSFSGDVGDWISGGQSYAYNTVDGDSMSVSSSGNALVSISVNGYNGDWWYLDFDAPTGQTLVPGTTYTGATRYPFNGSGPGLSLVGNGRGCNTLTGTFTISNAVFGTNGYVQTFDATFEQHCEGGTPAARGEVHISNPPPPPPLDLQIGVSAQGTASVVSGEAAINGTVTCNKSTSVYLSGTVVQVVDKEIVRGSFSTQLSCTPAAPVPWAISVSPSGTTPFTKGYAEVDSSASGYDSHYGQYVTVSNTTVVELGKLKP